MVCDLTGMELSNASLDEGTAAAEAMSMIYEMRSKDQKNNASKLFVSEQVLPQTLAVLKTRANPLEIDLVIGNEKNFDYDAKTFLSPISIPENLSEIIDLPFAVG